MSTGTRTPETKNPPAARGGAGLLGHLTAAPWAPVAAGAQPRVPPDFDVVLSARARLARNLAGYPFPHRATERDLRRIAQAVRQAAHADSELAHLYAIAIAPLSARDRSLLVDSRRISPELADGPRTERYALLDDPGALTVAIGEEDHVRIQALAAGNDLPAALRLAEDAEARLARRLEWARDPRWGFLTTSLGNVGTGLRLSLLVHLPALAFLGRLLETMKAAHRLDISVRGAHGERSQAAGDLYQISNGVSAGVPASHLVGLVKPVGDHLVAAEREARLEVAAGEAKRRAEDAARAAWARIEAADSLTAREALTLLSSLRLAAAAGLTPLGTDAPTPNAALFALLVSELHTGAGLAAAAGETESGAPPSVRDAIQRPARLRQALRAGGVRGR